MLSSSSNGRGGLSSVEGEGDGGKSTSWLARAKARPPQLTRATAKRMTTLRMSDLSPLSAR